MEFVGRAYAHNSLVPTSSRENICGAQWYPTTRTYASYEHCGPTCRVFPIMIFYHKLTVSWSFELIHRVLKKTKMFAGTFPKATVTGATAAALGQRTNVHTAVLSKCTHNCTGTEQMYTQLIKFSESRRCRFSTIPS